MTDIYDLTVSAGYSTPGRRKNKWNATAAPGATDDAGDGYEVGSVWVDTTADKAYVCVDSTTSSAVWIESGGGAGSAALDDLTDVDAASPSDGDVLAWSDGDSAWVPVAPGTPDLSAGSLDDLGDVDAAAPSDGDVLTWSDGDSAWVASAPAAAGDITTDPAWAAAGDLIVATGNDAAAVLTIGDEGDVLTVVGGDVAWAPPTASDAGSLHVDLDVSGAHEVDLADGSTHDLTLTGDAMFTLAGVTADVANDLRLILRQDGTGGWTVTWPGSVDWADGTEPVLQTDPDAVDVIGLLTTDDGTTWLGFHVTPDAISPATTVESETTWDITPAAGTSTDYARADHTHGTPAQPSGGSGGHILIADDHSTPLVFADLLQTEAGDDLLYSDT